MKNSLISIILPTYNVEKYIARALDSCVNQSFKNIEIIVVDDCGSDKSIEIAKDYAKKDERIKIIHNERNLGLLKARYEGAKIAGGGYILFLDPDDFLELNACEECAKILNVEKESDFIWFGFLYKENSAKRCECKKDFLQDKTFTIFEYCKNVLTQNNGICYWNLCSKMIKTEVYLTAFSCLDEKDIKLTMAEDALIYFFIILNCEKIVTSSKHIYYYCQNDSSSVMTNNARRIEKNLQDEKMVIRILSKFLNSHKKNMEQYLYIFLKITLIKLIMYKLLREIRFYQLTCPYVIYKLKKIINKFLIKYFILKIQCLVRIFR